MFWMASMWPRQTLPCWVAASLTHRDNRQLIVSRHVSNFFSACSLGLVFWCPDHPDKEILLSGVGPLSPRVVCDINSDTADIVTGDQALDRYRQ